jgi:hypothetical protein
MTSQPNQLVDFIKTTQAHLFEDDMIVDSKDNDQNVCSGSSAVTLIKLKASNQHLPKLVILLNSFIHFSTSGHCHKNFKMSGQFW